MFLSRGHVIHSAFLCTVLDFDTNEKNYENAVRGRMGKVEEAAIAAGVTKVRRIRRHFIKKP